MMLQIEGTQIREPAVPISPTIRFMEIGVSKSKITRRRDKA
jgi:hypothetical protein